MAAMPRPNVVVRLDKHGRGTVLIDGRPLEGVRAVYATAEAGHPAVVSITLYAAGIDLQQAADEGVPDAAAQQ